MMKNNKNPDPFRNKAYATNAGTEIYKTEPESMVPIASDQSVEEARDWVNNETRL